MVKLVDGAAEVRIGTYGGSEQPLSQAGAGWCIISKTCVTALASGVLQTKSGEQQVNPAVRCNLVAGQGQVKYCKKAILLNLPLGQ